MGTVDKRLQGPCSKNYPHEIKQRLFALQVLEPDQIHKISDPNLSRYDRVFCKLQT